MSQTKLTHDKIDSKTKKEGKRWVGTQVGIARSWSMEWNKKIKRRFKERKEKLIFQYLIKNGKKQFFYKNVFKI